MRKTSTVFQEYTAYLDGEKLQGAQIPELLVALSRTMDEPDLRVGVEICKDNAYVNDVYQSIVVDVCVRIPSTATARWAKAVAVEED